MKNNYNTQGKISKLLNPLFCGNILNVFKQGVIQQLRGQDEGVKVSKFQNVLFCPRSCPIRVVGFVLISNLISDLITDLVSNLGLALEFVTNSS